MPEQIMRDLVIGMLKDTDYDPSRISRKGSPKYLFKNYIISLDEDIDIVDDNSFEALIDLDEYNEIIFTETKYGLMRISRQSDAIQSLLHSEKSPKAWLLVTVYYHSFFCAILISRLLGRYSCYFGPQEISSIKCIASNSGKKNLDDGNYVGYYVSCPDRCVKIRFKNEGDRPHHTAWKNLHDKVPTSSRLAEADVMRSNRILLFKKILSENGKWQLPSAVRNTWNYSDISLYSKRGDETASEFSAFIGTNRDLDWASRKRLQPDEKNIATSIAFISSTLNRTLDTCKGKILR